MENKMVVRRVSVEMLLSVLTNLYEQGVDYVDVTGKINEEADHLGISVNENYLASKELTLDDIEFPKIEFTLDRLPRKLNEDDLNNLL